MRYIDNLDITDATRNLALEEYSIRHKLDDEDLLLFYINSNAIIIGRNQNTVEEIDSDVVAAKSIQVVRRVSGGGAVYHDIGNLNFSFMTRDVNGRFNRYDTFNGPVLAVLHDLGIPAELSGRNDIIVDGRKISGNAQFAASDRMLSHGTLLVDSNVDELVAALRPKPGKVESKGIKSIRSRVANINEFLSTPITAVELRERILEKIYGTRNRAHIPSVSLTDADWQGVADLRASRYANWDWNYGRNPSANVQRSQRFTGGEVDVRLDIQHNCIAAVHIYGDFMGQGEMHELCAHLIGITYDAESIASALATVDTSYYIANVTRAELIGLLAP
jgi:lipoate-protein ligase A